MADMTNPMFYMILKAKQMRSLKISKKNTMDSQITFMKMMMTGPITDCCTKNTTKIPYINNLKNLTPMQRQNLLQSATDDIFLQNTSQYWYLKWLMFMQLCWQQVQPMTNMHQTITIMKAMMHMARFRRWTLDEAQKIVNWRKADQTTVKNWQRQMLSKQFRGRRGIFLKNFINLDSLCWQEGEHRQKIHRMMNQKRKIILMMTTGYKLRIKYISMLYCWKI